MFNKNRCYNGGNRHKFEARYEEQECKSGVELSDCSFRPSLNDLRKLDILNVYIRDVCVWCGETIERR